MRDIKFRGISNYDSIFVYGDLQRDSKGNFYITEHTEEGLTFDVGPETVGQYTGLKDKNDKEIYGGDIVKVKGVYFKSRGEEVGIIQKTLLSTYLQNLSGYSDEYLGDYNEFEVIGNIYENPDLLEGANGE